jgi:hypothetical protein
MALSCNITTGSPEIGMPALLSWLPFERLYNYPALRKRAADAYAKQRYQAAARCIGWRFTLCSWWTCWAQSGLWEMRGQGLGRYQMARLGPDIGEYAPDNVRFITHEQNVNERSREHHRAACKRRSRRASWRAAVSAAAKRQPRKNGHFGSTREAVP